MSKPVSKDWKVCFETWNRQEETGFIFISKKQNGMWKDYSFSWPGEQNKIMELLSSLISTNSDVYWCPLIFKERKRLEINALPANVLYADLDFVKPETCTILPTVAWKSSSDRYQALWWIPDKLPPSELKELNKKLTYHIGADRGGWDITQVLRIPGTMNYKYEPPLKGELLWLDRTSVHRTSEFTKLTIKTENLSSQSPPETSFIQLLSKYRKQLGTKISRLLQYPDNKITQGSRSEVLWSLENDMVSKKIPLEDIALLIQGSAWNKYKGRSDEWKRIITEITKIYEGRREEIPEHSLEDETPEVPIKRWISFTDLLNSNVSKPGWLVEDIWLQGSHGMISGEPKTFKSTLAHDLAISVASGLPFLGKFKVNDQGPVLFIQNENSEWIMKDRSMKILGHKGLLTGNKMDSQLPIYFQNIMGFNFDDPLAMEDLENMIQEIKPIMVILDPLYLMFSGEINSAKELNPILQQLLEIKNKYQMALMVIHHWNKGGTSTRGGQRMLGSTTLHGWNESALYLHSVEEDGLEENQTKILIEREHRGAGILGKIEMTFKMGNAGDLLYEPVILDKTHGGPLITQLLDLLSMYPGGLSLSQIATDLKSSRQTIRTLGEKFEQKIEMIKGDRNKVILKLR